MLITDKPDDLTTLFSQGAVFAYPTEAVFGLGCDPDNENAVRRLLTIKKRPVSKGLILIASDFSQVSKYLKPLTNDQNALTLPSATTYVFPALESTPVWLTGNFNSLAVRITRHPLARELCDTLGSAIVSTSANISGQDPARSVDEVVKQLGDKIDLIVDGKLGESQKPSVIRDSISGEIIRS